jgi:hypothetical protein
MYRVCAEVVVKYDIIRPQTVLVTEELIRDLHVSQQPIIYSDA